VITVQDGNENLMSLPHRDIVIAGGRVAGSATAITLARSGHHVLLLERDRMPSDTLSTHVIWPDGLDALERLGALDQGAGDRRATGPPLPPLPWRGLYRDAADPL
jgi:flavin-dependent dehydrogenase